jgi:hypothetical protein
VLAGYSIPDEGTASTSTTDGEPFFETLLWPRLAHRASSFERCGHVRGWSGLYEVTPDRSGIAGAVPGFANFFRGARVHGPRRDAVVRGRAGGSPKLHRHRALRRDRPLAARPLALRGSRSWVTEAMHI